MLVIWNLCCHRSYSCRTIPEETATYSAHIIEAELDDRHSEETLEASELS